MKHILLISFLFILSFGFIAQQKELPIANQKMLDFVLKNQGKMVGRGECWDLVNIPLNDMEAKWDKNYNFGKLLNLKKDLLLPGDIIQFEKVIVKVVDGNKTYTQNYYHHTAVIVEVQENGVLKIAQQNTERGKRVSYDLLDTKAITKGKIMFYRPEIDN
jgi:hypothetical protein